jgi:hypothetical protein
MAQPQPPQPPQPPQQLLCWERDAESQQSLMLFSCIVNASISDILQEVTNAWEQERKEWVKQLSSCMVDKGVVPEDAEQYATTFMDALEKVNGKTPEKFPPNSDVKALVNKLILNLPLAAHDELLEFEEKYSWYSKYAYGFMQVRFEPIEVKVGCEEPSSELDWKYENLMMVYSQISLPNSVVVHPTKLKASFKALVLNKSIHFWERMSHSSEINYMKSATNVLLHKMFEKSGINFTGQTAEQIRDRVLGNVKYHKGLKNFDAIDTVLVQLISFLSKTYIQM